MNHYHSLSFIIIHDHDFRWGECHYDPVSHAASRIKGSPHKQRKAEECATKGPQTKSHHPKSHQLRINCKCQACLCKCQKLPPLLSHPRSSKRLLVTTHHSTPVAFRLTDSLAQETNSIQVLRKIHVISVSTLSGARTRPLLTAPSTCKAVT